MHSFPYNLSSSSNNYWIQISRKREQQFLFVLKYFTFYCQVNYRISHFDVYMYMIIIPFVLYPNYCDREGSGYFLSQKTGWVCMCFNSTWFHDYQLIGFNVLVCSIFDISLYRIKLLYGYLILLWWLCFCSSVLLFCYTCKGNASMGGSM